MNLYNEPVWCPYGEVIHTSFKSVFSINLSCLNTKSGAESKQEKARGSSTALVVRQCCLIVTKQSVPSHLMLAWDLCMWATSGWALKTNTFGYIHPAFHLAKSQATESRYHARWRASIGIKKQEEMSLRPVWAIGGEKPAQGWHHGKHPCMWFLCPSSSHLPGMIQLGSKKTREVIDIDGVRKSAFYTHCERMDLFFKKRRAWCWDRDVLGEM